MGLILSRIQFKNGIPSMGEIRKQFGKQTGLELQLRAYLNLADFPTNNRKIIEKLGEDIDKYEKFIEREFQGIGKVN